MLNCKNAFLHLELPESPMATFRALSEKFEYTGADPFTTASSLIKKMIDVDLTFDNADEARLTTLAIGEAAVKVGYEIPSLEEFVEAARQRVRSHLFNPANAWMYAKKEAAPVVQKAIVEGIDVAVTIKADGKIKKGGKQILLAELYKKHVLNAEKPLTNKELIEIIMKELDMSKAGATTYAYNIKKQLGERK